MSENIDSDSDTESIGQEGIKGEGSDFKWYIARTLTGHENKVIKSLRERIANHGKSDFFEDIMVPEEEVVSNAGGKKRTFKRKFFPGYILIRMIMNESTWHLVKETDKISGFIGGSSDKPVPISEEEAAYMTNKSGEGLKKTQEGLPFSEGEQVRVIEGPFTSFVGTVEAVSERGKIKVNVSIFGRLTPVELDFSQVDKVS